MSATRSSTSVGRSPTTPHCAAFRKHSKKNGTEVEQLSLAEADARRVEEVIAFTDPGGAAIEVFHGAILDHSPVVTPFGARFVTGSQGLGHVVFPVMDSAASFDFYTEVLGFYPRGAFRLPAPARIRAAANPFHGRQRAPPTAWPCARHRMAVHPA